MAGTVRRGGRNYRLAGEAHAHPAMGDREAPDGWVRNHSNGARREVRREARREARQGRREAIRREVALAD